MRKHFCAATPRDSNIGIEHVEVIPCFLGAWPRRSAIKLCCGKVWAPTSWNKKETMPHATPLIGAKDGFYRNISRIAEAMKTGNNKHIKQKTISVGCILAKAGYNEIARLQNKAESVHMTRILNLAEAATCSHLQPAGSKWLEVARSGYKWLQMAAQSKWLQVAAFLKITKKTPPACSMKQSEYCYCEG